MTNHSNFRKAVRVLAEVTDFPVFQTMVETQRPIVIGVEVRRAAVKEPPEGLRGKARGAVWRLSRSKRYLEAMCAEGAVAHDQDGRPAYRVSERDQEWARARLAEKAAVKETG